jgi:hypothetical protein
MGILCGYEVKRLKLASPKRRIPQKIAKNCQEFYERV